MRKGTNGTVKAVLVPEYSTDALSVKLSGTGGVTVKKGIIYAKRVTKPGKPAKVTVKCGKLKYVVEVTVTKYKCRGVFYEKKIIQVPDSLCCLAVHTELRTD